MSAFADHDFLWMAEALRIAQQGLYTTSPNPRVGCVMVKNQQIVGQGAHLRAGEPHAEIHALRQAGDQAVGADIYVTLEPCSHHGRTPPCVDAVIAAQPKRVIIATQDPNPLVAGNGIAALQAAGIPVEVGVMQKESQALNAGFNSRMLRGRPLVRCKLAASLDGRTALENGKSQWITSAAARMDVQHWRAQSCAVMTGIGTILADNPSMRVRLPNVTRQPLRIIVDSHLQTPPTCQLLDTAIIKQAPVLIVYASDFENRAAALAGTGAELLQLPNNHHQVDLPKLLNVLAQRGVNELLLEAGQGLSGALLAHGLIDEFIFYYAPKLMGSAAKGMFAMPALTEMQQALELQVTEIRPFGNDWRVLARCLNS